jgi:TonB-linked SusC/RagA family outer membrane protein
MKKLILTLISLVVVSAVAFAQGTVTGTVTSDNGESLIGANVIVTGQTIGTVTDFNGEYSIDIPEGAVELTFSYTGFEPVVVTIDGRSTIDIQMLEGVGLDEVVVTALGISRKEKALGYAVQEVGAEEISRANTVSAIDALAGAAAGVQVTSSSGAAGAPSRIVIRGQTSFNGDNEALIVIDGIRMNNDENQTERALGGVANSNRAIDLNPNDIEKVTVLKGAAATALYGIEGARGVVLITTKRGNKGKGVSVDFSAGTTFSTINNVVGLQNTYLQGSNGVWQGPETGQSGSWGPHISQASWDGSDYKWDKNGRIVTDGTGTPFKPYDNVDDFYKTGVAATANLAFSGGSELGDYRLSFAYTDDNGVTPLNEFKRYNVGLNMGTSLLNNKLKVRVGANYVNSGGRRVQQGSNTSGVMLGLLRTPISFDNSNGLSDPVGYSLEDAIAAGQGANAYQFLDGTQRNYRGGGGYDNPFWVVNNAPFFDRVNRFFGNVNASYEISKWVSVNAVLGLDAYADNRIQRFEIGSRNVTGGQVIEDNYNYRHTDFYFSLSGGGNLNSDFTLNYNAGVNMYSQRRKQNYIQGDALNFVGFMELGNTANISSQITNTNLRTLGLYGTLDLGFRDYLYLSLTARNDWSSTLIDPANKFNSNDISFLYPSVSLGFVFSEFINWEGLTFGKFRASYAEVGGGAPAPYLTSTPWILPLQNAGTINDLNDGWTNGIGFPYKGSSGFVKSGVAGNPSLIPSRTRDIEFGLDLRFMNRIGLDMTYYTRSSKDQIIAINIPNTTGFQRAVVNNGLLETVGGEVVLTVNAIKKQNFTWDIGINFSKWKTTVESLPEGVPNQYLDGFTGTGIYNIAPVERGDGSTIVYEYGQILGGAFQRVNTAGGTFDATQPYNPDGALVIDDDPTSGGYGFPLADPIARVIGNPNPDFLMGITNTFGWKGLSLSFLFDIREGGDIWNGTKGALTFFGRTELTENRGTISVFEGIRASDGGANDIAVELNQQWYKGNGGGFGSVDEHFVEDGSFRRLRYLTLSYDFARLIKSSNLSNLTVSFTGRNLFLSTPYTGFDPELSLVGSSSNGQGLDYFQQPNVKSFSFGISVGF